LQSRFNFSRIESGVAVQDEGAAAAVVVAYEAVDLLDQVSDASEGSAPNRPPGDDVEPDLDLVEPGGVGRGVVDVEAGTCGEPATSGCVFVGRVIVDDEMNVELLRHRSLDVA
jgi:hypothetical protein